MWVDKYKPQARTDLVGNPGVVTKLSDWLKNWYVYHCSWKRITVQLGKIGKEKEEVQPMTPQRMLCFCLEVLV